MTSAYSYEKPCAACDLIPISALYCNLYIRIYFTVKKMSLGISKSLLRSDQIPLRLFVYGTDRVQYHATSGELGFISTIVGDVQPKIPVDTVHHLVFILVIIIFLKRVLYIIKFVIHCNIYR